MGKKKAERRRHKRQDLACPVTLKVEPDQTPARGKTANISDGGALLPVPDGPPPPVGATVSVKLGIPRTTLNTYMLEEFTCRALVLRHQAVDGGPFALALQFLHPLDLMLEV